MKITMTNSPAKGNRIQVTRRPVNQALDVARNKTNTDQRDYSTAEAHKHKNLQAHHKIRFRRALQQVALPCWWVEVKERVERVVFTRPKVCIKLTAHKINLEKRRRNLRCVLWSKKKRKAKKLFTYTSTGKKHHGKGVNTESRVNIKSSK